MGHTGIPIEVGDYKKAVLIVYFGAIVQYPNSDGSIEDYRDLLKNPF